MPQPYLWRPGDFSNSAAPAPYCSICSLTPCSTCNKYFTVYASTSFLLLPNRESSAIATMTAYFHCEYVAVSFSNNLLHNFTQNSQHYAHKKLYVPTLEIHHICNSSSRMSSDKIGISNYFLVSSHYGATLFMLVQQWMCTVSTRYVHACTTPVPYGTK